MLKTEAQWVIRVCPGRPGKRNILVPMKGQHSNKGEKNRKDRGREEESKAGFTLYDS